MLFDPRIKPVFQVNELWQVIDAFSDPQPAWQYIPHICGEPKEQPLPMTKGIQGHARYWMIDLTWLQNNSSSNAKSSVTDNGRAWGDPTDPEEDEE